MVIVWFLAFFALVSSSCARKAVMELEEFSTPEKTYRLWIETADKGDIPNNIRCITDASKRTMDLQLRQMDVFMERMSANVKVFKTYSIAEQKMRGDRAVVVLKGKKGDITIVPFRKEDEGWKVDLVSLFTGAG